MGAGAGEERVGGRDAAGDREKTLTLNRAQRARSIARGARAFHGSGCRTIKTIKVHSP